MPSPHLTPQQAPFWRRVWDGYAFLRRYPLTGSPVAIPQQPLPAWRCAYWALRWELWGRRRWIRRAPMVPWADRRRDEGWDFREGRVR